MSRENVNFESDEKIILPECCFVKIATTKLLSAAISPLVSSCFA